MKYNCDCFSVCASSPRVTPGSTAETLKLNFKYHVFTGLFYIYIFVLDCRVRYMYVQLTV